MINTGFKYAQSIPLKPITMLKSHLKAIIFGGKRNFFFTIFQLRLRYCVIKIIVILNSLPILGLSCFKPNLIDKNRISLEMKILPCIQNDVVVDFIDVIRIAHCACNIESTLPVAILTFKWTLYVTKGKKDNAVIL